MLAPNNRKFRKEFKGRNCGRASQGNIVTFGEFGMKSASNGRITARQIEAARRAITRHVKRGGKLYIPIFPDKPISKKPLEVRQGKGKGAVEYYVFEAKPGHVLFEIEGISEEIAREAFARAAAKLGVQTVFARREVL